MHDDDRPLGRVLSRREVMALLGSAGAGLAAARLGAQAGRTPREAPAPAGATVGGAAASGGTLRHLPSCVVRPQQIEGPYFVDTQLDRSDIRSDPRTGALSEGTSLSLEIRVMQVGSGSCAPLPGAVVDIWQCDAAGVYSDVRDTNGFFDTRGQRFLRGLQRTDAGGVARFQTIYPGWYEGRTVHIHFKIRSSSARRAHEFTSQLYFDDALTDQVLQRPPYDRKSGAGRVRNERDGIFRRGGQQLLLSAVPAGSGYSATFDIGLAIG